MAKTNKTNSVDNVVIKDDIIDVKEKMNEETKNVENNSIKTKPLSDSDEIEVISLVPNVSYKDRKTLDIYEWNEIGHSEFMTYETLKNMWRNDKGYFKNMWLKPNDNRIINQFGLTKTFEKYEYLMDASNYTKNNIKNICEAIAETPNGLKIAICDKVKSLVINGEVSDIFVIKTLENRLKIDLIGFL